jgi:hypothetical protein
MESNDCVGTKANLSTAEDSQMVVFGFLFERFWVCERRPTKSSPSIRLTADTLV